jgi:carboxymethylenebutenolidase
VFTQFLNADSGTTGKIGCIGFCSGGRQALMFACNTKSLAAAVDCWGGFTTRATPDAVTTATRPKPIADMIEGLCCPLYLAAGEEDQNPSPEVARELVQRAEGAGKSAKLKIYKGGHAFFADWRANYREAPAFELWDDVVAFFGAMLRS